MDRVATLLCSILLLCIKSSYCSCGNNYLYMNNYKYFKNCSHSGDGNYHTAVSLFTGNAGKSNCIYYRPTTYIPFRYVVDILYGDNYYQSKFKNDTCTTENGLIGSKIYFDKCAVSQQNQDNSTVVPTCSYPPTILRSGTLQL
jgi:hypothetical protein